MRSIEDLLLSKSATKRLVNVKGKAYNIPIRNVYSYVCAGCGIVAYSSVRPRFGGFCSPGCGNANRLFRGGFVNKDGYRIIGRNGLDYPEHRWVMEQHLKRPLRRHENVHHKNGIKTDNRIKNLELWIKTQPCGQRLNDILKFVVKEYRYELINMLKVK